jgi:hypothetical protein
MTSFLVVLDHDECITLVSVEPRQSNGSVVYISTDEEPAALGRRLAAAAAAIARELA